MRHTCVYVWRNGGCNPAPKLARMVKAPSTAIPRTALGRTQRLNACRSAYAGMWYKREPAVDAYANSWAGGAENRGVPHNRSLAVRWHLQPVAHDVGGWSGPGWETRLKKSSRASRMASAEEGLGFSPRGGGTVHIQLYVVNNKRLKSGLYCARARGCTRTKEIYGEVSL